MADAPAPCRQIGIQSSWKALICSCNIGAKEIVPNLANRGQREAYRRNSYQGSSELKVNTLRPLGVNVYFTINVKRAFTKKFNGIIDR